MFDDDEDDEDDDDDDDDDDDEDAGADEVVARTSLLGPGFSHFVPAAALAPPGVLRVP